MTFKNQQELVHALNECAAICDRCAASCLEEKDIQMLAKCIKLDIDCAQLCRVTASFASRGSAHTIILLDECAELCNVCAEECEKHSHMEHCQQCAEACRHCAEICSQMIAV